MLKSGKIVFRNLITLPINLLADSNGRIDLNIWKVRCKAKNKGVRRTKN